MCWFQDARDDVVGAISSGMKGILVKTGDILVTSALLTFKFVYENISLL
jgi:hypothetical protein